MPAWPRSLRRGGNDFMNLIISFVGTSKKMVPTNEIMKLEISLGKAKKSILITHLTSLFDFLGGHKSRINRALGPSYCNKSTTIKNTTNIRVFRNHNQFWSFVLWVNLL